MASSHRVFWFANLVLQCGCFSYRPVRPTELPKLEDESVEFVLLERPNGELISVAPGSRVRLRRLRHPAYEIILLRPCEVQVDGDVLRYRTAVRSGEEPLDVLATDVGHVDWVRTGLIAGPIIAVLSFITWSQHFRHGNECSYRWWRCQPYL